MLERPHLFVHGFGPVACRHDKDLRCVVGETAAADEQSLLVIARLHTGVDLSQRLLRVGGRLGQRLLLRRAHVMDQRNGISGSSPVLASCGNL